MEIYCINAARYLFQAEPLEVTAFSTQKKGDPRFQEVDEMTSAVMRFPGERFASFTASFGAYALSRLHIIGTRGEFTMEGAYEYSALIEQEWKVNERKKKRDFKVRDQFAPELIYFSKCVLENKNPQPSGKEGLADVRIIEALYQSEKTSRAVKLAIKKLGSSLDF